MSGREPTALRLLVVLFVVAGACGGSSQAEVNGSTAPPPTATPPVTPLPAVTSTPVPVAAPTPDAGPIRFHVTATGPMIANSGEPPMRWMASGPPGGPLYVNIEEVDGEQIDAAALRALVQARLPAQQSPHVFGEPTQVALAGASRLALPVITGQSLARTLSCFVVVPAPGSGRSLLTRWAVGAGAQQSVDCALAMSHPQLRPIADSFGLD